MATEEFTEAFIPAHFGGEVKNVEVLVNDNSRQAIGTREVSTVESIPGSSGRSFNSVEIPVLYEDATEDEEKAATVAAKKLIDTDNI